MHTPSWLCEDCALGTHPTSRELAGAARTENGRRGGVAEAKVAGVADMVETADELPEPQHGGGAGNDGIISSVLTPVAAGDGACCAAVAVGLAVRGGHDGRRDNGGRWIA